MRSPRQIVYAYHAKLSGLQPDFVYLYAAIHDGAEPEFATFRTAPHGRAPLTFTSFGDQSTPTLGKKFVPPEGVTIANPPFCERQSRLAGGGRYHARVERLKPLFHLFNGDLCYANLAEDRVRTWSGFLGQQQPQRPQASLDALGGNHENELGNGPIGYQATKPIFRYPKPPARRRSRVGFGTPSPPAPFV